MITKEEFTNFLTKYKNFLEYLDKIQYAISGNKYSSVLYDLPLCMEVDTMVEVFIESHFTDKGVDWISYYLWEPTEDKFVYVKQDKDMFNEEKEIKYELNTMEDLWNFLQTDVKLYFKNV